MALSPKIRANPVNGANAFYPPHTRIFEYDPVSNHFTDVTPAGFGFRLTHSFETTMLVLPTGQVLVSDYRGRIAVYTPGGSPDSRTLVAAGDRWDHARRRRHVQPDGNAVERPVRGGGLR